MNTRACAILLFGFAIIVATPTSAATDEGDCRNGGFPRENNDFGLAVIKGEGRAYLLADMDGCPNASPECKKWGYVLPGNKVVTGRAKGDYVCAYYPNKRGGSAGWVDRSRLGILAIDRQPPPSSWLGNWSDGDNPAVRVAWLGRALHMTGEAFWPGPYPEAGWPPGWPHAGELDGVLTLAGDRGHYGDGEDDGCEIEFRLVGDTLIASDNSLCGGANVRFDGVYQRPKR